MTRLTGIVSVLAFSMAFFFANGGFAQTTAPVTPDNGKDRVEAKFVGVAGGVLLGAEVVVAVEAAFGVDAKWAYLTFPLLGAAGGGVGGYFVEKASTGGAVAMLVGGIAMLIPTAILASVATSYDPEDDGAVVEESAGGEFSFELPPGEAEMGAETTTEVEARPEGDPDNLPPPPPEAKNSSQGAASGGVASRLSVNRAKRLEYGQKLRRATAGSLFYVDPGHGAYLTVPNVFVVAPSPSDEQRLIGTRSAVEVHVPLLRIDLP